MHVMTSIQNETAKQRRGAMMFTLSRAAARRCTALSLTGLLLASSCVTALAQTPTPPPANTAQQTTTTQSNTPMPPVSRPIPQRTVGLDPSKVVSWTLRDAILKALENNVDIELERENVRLAQYDIVAAQGF